jgi:uncharacterized protein YbjT (DUF2867 family)
MRVLMVGATGRHRLAQPYSLSAKFCSVDYRDVAEVAARAMTGGDASELSYGTFELSAPGIADSHQTAAIISEVLGRTITAVQSPLDQVRFPAARRAVLRRHELQRSILGREPRSLKDYPRELASR